MILGIIPKTYIGRLKLLHVISGINYIDVTVQIMGLSVSLHAKNRFLKNNSVV